MESAMRKRNTGTKGAPKYRRIAAGLGLAMVLWLPALKGEARAAASVCPPTINSCGCVINAPGAYKVGLALTASQGLTPTGECIGIAASFVTLDVGKKAITGAGGSSPTGIGIHVRRVKGPVILEGRGAVISGFDLGLLIESNNSVVDNFAVNSNGTAGLKVFKARLNTLSNITATSNLNYGVWLQHVGASELISPKTNTNGNIGIYIGCSDIGPISATCPGVGGSVGDEIYSGNIAGNVNYGIALDTGALNAIITNNTLGAGGAHNGKNDLFDANTNCDNNQWFANDSTATTSQTCIK